MKPLHRVALLVAAGVVGFAGYVVTRRPRAPHANVISVTPIAARADDAAVVDAADEFVRPSAIAGWCASRARANAIAVDAGCEAPAIGCIENDAGVAWGFEVRSSNVTADNEGCTVAAKLAVVRGDGDGGIGGATTLELSQETSGTLSFRKESTLVRFLGDYDGDGDEEVLVTRDWWAHEGGSGKVSSVWTFARGAVTPYETASAFVIAGAEDADRDGKVDLVTAGPYAHVEAFAQIGFWYPIGPALFLEHALAGGTFSMNDAVAVAFTQAKCKSPAEPNAQIVCDRLRGKSEADVLDAQRKGGCVDFLEDPARYPQSCAKWIAELAAIAPPFKI